MSCHSFWKLVKSETQVEGVELGSIIELVFLPALNLEMENSHSPGSLDAWFFTHSQDRGLHTSLPPVKKCPGVGACVGEGLGVLALQDTATEEGMT